MNIWLKYFPKYFGSIKLQKTIVIDFNLHQEWNMAHVKVFSDIKANTFSNSSIFFF